MRYRLKGGDTLPAPGTITGGNQNAAIDPGFRGNASAALTRTNIDRTLGASTRQGWRLACTPAERKAHGSKVTRNNVTLAGLDPDPRPRPRFID